MIIKILMKKYFLILVFLLGLHNSYSQDKLIKKAEKQYDDMAYASVNSKDLFDKLVAKDFSSSAIYTKLGNSYYFNADYKNALKAYTYVTRIKDKDGYSFSKEELFRYAQCLKTDGQFAEASKVLKELNSKEGRDAIDAETEYLKNIENQSNRFTIKPVSVNSKMPDFGTAFYKEKQVLFASARDTNTVERLKDGWSKKPFYKLYEATITEDGDLVDEKKLSGKVNSVFHQSTPVVTSDGKQMYFTRSNFFENKFGVDDTKANRLRIFRATLVNDKWTKIEDLSINNDAFSNAHPALSSDDKTLYFASDRPGSLGDTDLYEVQIYTDGSFGEVKNLGSSINTVGRESFPFVSNTGKFYFASDGHAGLGGLDVFEAIKNADKTYNVVNVGKPINSPEDDFSFAIDSETHKGFFTSKRTGDDDIYSFIELEPLKVKEELTVYGKIVDKTYNEPLPNVKITIYDANNKVVDQFYTDNAGEYLLKVPVGDYTVTYEKMGYLPQTDKLSVTKNDINKMREANKAMEIDPNANSLITDGDKEIIDGSDLTKQLNLQPIYFDFDGAKIKPISEKELNRVIQVLKDYPTISIDVRSHTDSRGSSEYNQALSDRRAQATVNYLLEKGVRSNRVSGQGYGESQLKNKCSDGVKCSEKQHQLNRRSEFIIHFNKN